MSERGSRIGILKPGSTFSGMIERFGDYDAWFVRALAPTGSRCDVYDAVGGELPDPGVADGWIVTGARTSVVDGGPSVTRLLDWIRAAMDAEAPLLGVCYGHQAIAAAAGGRVERHPTGWELGTVDVELTPAGRDDVLFAGLPSRFLVQTTHEDHVVEAPPGGRVLARNAHSDIQALAVGATCRAVQFHPEVTAAIATDFVDRRATLLERRPGVAETPLAARVLANFVDGFAGRRPGARR